MEKLLLELQERELTISNGKLNQTERNNLKSELTDSLVDVLNGIQEGELNAIRTIDGVAIEIVVGNKTIFATIDPVIKPLDYDIDVAISEYQEKVEAKAERERKLQEKKDKALADKKTKKAE